MHNLILNMDLRSIVAFFNHSQAIPKLINSSIMISSDVASNQSSIFCSRFSSRLNQSSSWSTLLYLSLQKLIQSKIDQALSISNLHLWSNFFLKSLEKRRTIIHFLNNFHLWYLTFLELEWTTTKISHAFFGSFTSWI